jgi:hypothetical protein
MPSKSRKNRRYSPQTKKVATNLGNGFTQSTSQPFAVQDKRAANSYGPNKAAAELIPTGGYLLHELKWIGAVTAIIIVLLIAAFYIFH